MPRIFLAFVILVLAVSPASALVLMHDHEQHGREPFKAEMDGAWKQIATILNAPGREYWRDKGSSGFGSDHHQFTIAYRGDAANLNLLLRTLAELPGTAKAEVVLLPGAGAITDMTGRRISCDWRARLTYSRHFDFPNRPANQPSETLQVRLEVFIPDLPSAAEPASARQIAAWIEELDHQKFAIREKAHRELSRQGPSIRNALQEALAAKPTPETKRRLERILEQFSCLQLSDITKPRGLPMRSFDMVVDCERKLLISKDPATRWNASNRLHEAVDGSGDLLKLLVAVLDDKSLDALIAQSRDAPKDYLNSFKPLLDSDLLQKIRRDGSQEAYRHLRARLDRFCK